MERRADWQWIPEIQSKEYHSEVTSAGMTKFKNIFLRNPLISGFIIIHTFFAIFLGRQYALAPDEGGYLYTFNNLYGHSSDPNPQYSSGWITAPKIFLWISYLPAKILNMVGVADYLSIRMLSIFLSAGCIYLLRGMLNRSGQEGKVSQKAIFVFFFIPSIFVWTSVGLRESFIMAELSAFLVGFNLLRQDKNKQALLLLFLGSYGLVSTKSYLWACLMVALIFTSLIFLIQGFEHRRIAKLLIAGLVVPVIAFASTTSVYALGFIFHSDISVSGQRSGDSVSQIYVDLPGSGTGTGAGSGTGTGTGTGSGSGSGSGSGKQLITFHGDGTLIALHFYLVDNPNSVLSRIFRVFHFDRKIQSIWDEKVKLGLVSKDNQVGIDTSSLNGHILKPGEIQRPLSLIWPAFVFLCGPFPFIGDPGIAVSISALESPLWWALYALIIFQLLRFRKVKFLQDPPILFTLIFIAGSIAFSALVEVNLGTSFRHRSILLVPLVFLYVRLAQRAKEQRDLELGVI